MIVIGDLMARYYANACDRIFGLIDPQKPTEPLTDQSGSVGIRPEFDERNQATREYCGDGVGHEQRVQQAAKVDLISPRELFEGLASGTPSAEYSAEQEAIRHAASTQNVFGQRATVIQQYHERLSRRNQLLHQQIVDSEVAPPADQWTPEELDQAKEYAEQCEPYEPQRIDLREEARKLRKEQLDRMPWHVPALNRKPEFVGDSSEFGAIAIDPKPLEELREELKQFVLENYDHPDTNAYRLAAHDTSKLPDLCKLSDEVMDTIDPRRVGAAAANKYPDEELNARIQKLADATRKRIEEAACERLPDDVLAAIHLHDAKEAAHSKPCKGKAISKALKHGQLTKEQSHYLLNYIPDEYIKEYAEQYL